MSNNAPSELVQFQYRDRFKLSYEEFLDEPYHLVVMNMEIMRIEQQVEQENARRAERQARQGARMR